MKRRDFFKKKVIPPKPERPDYPCPYAIEPTDKGIQDAMRRAEVGRRMREDYLKELKEWEDKYQK